METDVTFGTRLLNGFLRVMVIFLIATLISIVVIFLLVAAGVL